MIQGSNQDFQAENGSTHQQKPSPSAPYESSGSDLYKHISISDSSHQIRDRDSSSFGTIRPLKGDLVRIVADLQRGNKSPQQGPTLTTSLSPQRFGGGRG
jgi:hypothetical protein